MAQLIQLTRADNNHTSQENQEITVNVARILMIEDNQGRDQGASRVTMENGKAILVEESQDEIRELANAPV